MPDKTHRLRRQPRNRWEIGHAPPLHLVRERSRRPRAFRPGLCETCRVDADQTDEAQAMTRFVAVVLAAVVTLTVIGALGYMMP
jgi:hypothetical protein